MREAHPDIHLEVIGTDTLLDLHSGDCDLAIRYIKTAPADLESHELFRDNFVPVCSPALLSGGEPIENLANLGRFTLVHWNWSPLETHPPTWRWWLDQARSKNPAVPDIDEINQLTLKEELHAIDAVIAGEGIALFSDVLIAHELETGVLVRAAKPDIPGWGYYVVYLSDHPRRSMIEEFARWAISVI